MASAFQVPSAQSIVVQQVPQVGRTSRRPSHTFSLAVRPYQIQPMMIAPVLPGDTMKNLLLQARVVTDPVRQPLVGWWAEYYFFYVKLRDLENRDDVTNMILTGTALADDPADVKTYHNGTGVDWVRLCLNRVTDVYFRDEDQIGSTFEDEGLPLAKVGNQTFLDSAILDAKIKDADEDMPGQPTTDLPPNMSAFSDQYAHWEAMRSMGIVAVDFEDYLKTYGVKVQKEDEDPHEPELIRYTRAWQYPSNTIDPATGKPSSAVSWSVAERADKDRFFREPGFIFGVQVVRPKVLLGAQTANGSSMLDTPMSWLPAVLLDQPYTSLRKYDDAVGPLAGATGGEDYWIDVRDLFVHGDQFTNRDITTDPTGYVTGLPRRISAGELLRDFPTSGDISFLFAGDDAPTRAAARVRSDGRVDLNILSRVEDTTR